MNNVINSTNIEFREGILLSKEILEQLDFQSKLFSLQYSSCPAGIIYGFEFIEKDGSLYISKGMLKYKERYYFSDEDINAAEAIRKSAEKKNFDKTDYMSLCLVPQKTPVQNYQGISSYTMKLKLISHNEKSENYFVLAEFQYTGSESRDWKNNGSPLNALFDQTNTQGYHFSMISANYSLPYETTMSPYIFGLMRECLENMNSKSPADIALLFQLSQNRIISLKLLENWFAENGIYPDMKDRKSIIREFVEYAGGNRNKRRIPPQTLPEQTEKIPEQKKNSVSSFGI